MVPFENLVIALCLAAISSHALVHMIVRRALPALLDPRTPKVMIASAIVLVVEALTQLGGVRLPHVVTLTLIAIALVNLWLLSRGFLRAVRTETNLEKVLQERTVELHRAQTDLVQAEKLASVGLVAAGVAHEINNPAAYVLANLTLLREELAALQAQRLTLAAGAASVDAPPRADARASDRIANEALRDALEGILRIRDIVTDLNSLAQKGERKTEPVNLAKVVETSVALTTATVRARASIGMSLEHVPLVLGHRGKLSQVVINLIVNAAEAMPQDGVQPGRIEVRMRARGLEVVLEVSDDGRGIPAAELGEIFQPLYTTKTSGTGLGLAISRRIIEEHGGRIEVESVLGEGTTFRVVLPALPPLDARDPPQPAGDDLDASPPVVASGTPTAPPGVACPANDLDERKLVMVVDDEAFLLRVLTRFIGRRFRVESATSVDDALRRIRESTTPDVILCDLMMPGKTGAELYFALQRERPELAARITFMSGGGTDEELNHFPNTVGRPTLLKPLEPDTLLAYLDAQVDVQPSD